MFDIIWLMTRGGPAKRTEHLPILVYKTMFRTYEIGYAAAIAIVMILSLLVAAGFYFRLTGGFEGGTNET